MRTKLALAFSAFLFSLGGVAHAAVDNTGSNAAPAPVAASQPAFEPSLAASGTSGPTPSIVPGLNQLGLGAQRGLPYPSDQSGAIGPDYYVQGVNNMGVAVFRRSDLAMVAGPVSLGTFSNAPNEPEVVDSQFMWDNQTQRFYYSFTYKKWVNNVRTAGILYGWTKTSDPTDLAGGWCQMRIDTGNDFDDRPKLGDNATHLIMPTNADPWSGADYDRVWTIPKPANGSTTCPASPQSGVKVFGSVSNPLKTSDGDIVDSAIAAQDNDGSANGWIVAADDRTASANQIMLWHVNSSGDLVADGNVAVNSYSAPPGIPQPSPNQPLDPVDQRLNSAVADTDPDVGATALWTSHTIADPSGSGRSVVRWYELVPGACAPVSGVCSSGVRRQQGEVSDPSNYLFNAAMAPTDSGNEAVLHYDSASASQLVQVRARSRVSNTPLGTLGPEITVETSDAPYDEPTCHDSRPYCRWGDYPAATTDPADPHAVWGTNQAIAPANGGNMHWKSRNFAIQPTASPALIHSATGASGGDGDGVVEPGESVDLNETVRNGGGAGASSISGTLASGTSGLSITNAASPYPNVAAGATASNSTAFGASVASTVACGTPLSMGVTLNTAQGRYRVPLTLATGSPGSPQTANATDVPKAIPDGSPTGASSTINVTSGGRVSDLKVTVGRIDHTWLGDIEVFLIGPDGTKVMLADRPGGYLNGDNNMVSTVFDDDASAPLSAGVAPYTGTFKPASPLSAFDGKPLQGAWTLKVVDVSSGDTGSIVSWGTRLTPALCDVSSPNTPPAAGFSVSPQPALTGQTVTFASTSTDPDGSIASQAWDLDNDGSFNDGTGTSASRSFTPSGTYTVRLRVTDNGGASSTVSKTVTIDNRPPSASFTAAPDPSLSGQAITLTSTSTDPDGTVTAHAWDLDNDGQFNDGAGATATKAFAKAGSYTVRLRETDNTGATSIASRTVTVDNRAPSASFSVSPTAPVSGSAITFTSTSSDPDGTIASQAWDLDNDGAFDDGTSATASKAFATPGTYTVRLQVTDDNGAAATSSQTVTVANRSPVAAFSFAPGAPSTGQAVTFTSSSSDPDGTIASQSWDLDNDGVYDNGSAATASKTFAKAGTYTVGLKVTDDNGGTDTTSKTVTVANRPPVADFTISPNPTSTGQTVTFDSATSSDPDGTVKSVAWDLDNDGAFDDGAGATATRSFSTAKTYTVRLQVTDDNNASATKSATVTIDNRAPTAKFSFTPTTPTSGQDVTFTSESTDPDGAIASQAWDLDDDGAFDDGTATTATHAFAKRGSYLVHLKVTDTDGGTSTATQTVSVTNRKPVAAFDVAPQTVVTGQPTRLDASASTDPDGTVKDYLWDLDGDGVFETDTGTNPVTSRFYANPGNVIVGLQVTDDDGATAVTQRTVTVDEAPPFADGPTVPPPDSGPLPGVDPTPSPPDPAPQPKPGKPPRGSVRVLTHSLAETLRRGLPLRFSSSEAATARFIVVAGTRRLAARTKLVGAGRASLRLRLSSRPRGPVTVKMTLIDAGGLSRTYSASVKLR